MSAQSTTNYPVSLDSPQGATENDFLGTLGGLDLPAVTNFIYGMLQAIETKLGIDNSGVNNSIDYRVRNGWNTEAAALSYLSPTSFSINTNKTAIYSQGTKLRFNSATTPIYVVVTSSSYNGGSGLTTVNTDQSIVPNPINSLDYAIQPLGNKLITQSQVSIQNPTSSQVGGLVTTNLSATAGILGTQMASDTIADSNIIGMNANKLTNINSIGLQDFVVSGFGTTAQSGLAITIQSGVLYINGQYYSFNGDGGHTYTASKDTYVDIDNTGAFHYNAVSNGASSPSLTANSVRVRKVITNGSAITTVTTNVFDSNNVWIYPNSPFQKLTTYQLSPTAGITLSQLASNPYKCRVHLGSNQSVSNSSFTTIQFASIDWDTNNNFSSNTYTCPVAGYYLISLMVSFAAGGTGINAAIIDKNAGDVIQASNLENASNGTSISVSDILKCNAGDTITAKTFQNSGGSLNILGNAGGSTSAMSILYLSS